MSLPDLVRPTRQQVAKVCDALGVDDSHTSRILIEPNMVTVTRWDDEAKALVDTRLLIRNPGHDHAVELDGAERRPT